MAERDRQAQPVIQINPATYERLCEADALTDELFLAARPLERHGAVRGAVLTFRDVFEPDRLDEDGHVEYALAEALKMMLRVAAQEARKK